MNQISRKLRSNSGASMLIALVFMMFCLFVGGSVLASATANGYRVEHLSDQQDFLSQRSAGLLLADEIDGSSGTEKLQITDVVLAEVPKVLLPGGGVANDSYTGRTTKETRTITFTADFTENKPMTAMQRLMFESAVCRYLKENNVTAAEANDTDHITLAGFYYLNSEGTVVQVTKIAEFWHPYDPDEEDVGGSVTITGAKDAASTPFTTYQAHFLSGADDELFDFLVTFDNTQMTVSANAYMSRREITQPGDIRDDTGTYSTLPAGYTAVYEISASTIKSTIKWEDASIRKGGA